MLMVLQLVQLQVIKGEEYRNTSQSRLFREASVQAPRGEIFDRNGVLVATNREAFNVQMVKTSIEPEKFNQMIISLIKILEKNSNSYRDNFPMTINPIKLEFKNGQEEDGLKIKQFKKKFKVKDLNISDKQLFDEIRKYYEIPDYFSVEDARKVMAIRYEMATQPLSQFDPVEIAVDVSKETVAELEERNIDFPGVSISIQPVREYPNGAVAAHIIGYIGKINEREFKERKDNGYRNNDIIGKDGLEKSLEDLLKGENGSKKVEMDTMGRLTGEIGGSSPEPGNNIHLTIDLELQKVAEKSLQETIKKINSGGYKDRFEDARSGAVVAIDVSNGEVLALASYPSYEPSQFVDGLSAEEWQILTDTQNKQPLYNRAIQGTYSPGSTFKMVTALAALEEKKVTIGERIKDEGRYTRYSDYQPRCWIWNQGHRTHGYVNISDAIKVSCNYFFYEMGYRTGIDNINKYAKMFGLGSKTGIELPGERAGILAGPEYKEANGDRWYPGNTLQAAIGQSDYSFSPVQMANYIATLTNGGTRNRPRLISKVTTWNGAPVDESRIKEVLSINLGEPFNDYTESLNINEQNIKAVFEGMKSVTGDAGGTAYGTFAGFPISVGGKTGTVQVPGNKSDHALFVGFAPYENPKIAIAVLIEHGGHGSYTAPVARDIIAQYYKIYKDDSQEENVVPSETDVVPDAQQETQDSNHLKQEALTSKINGLWMLYLPKRKVQG